ncbi:hypothetical protein ABBQ38_001295 [Trebouxia sp. C0009 RCD-2024]
MGSKPFTPQDQPLLLAAGLTKVAHLQAALIFNTAPSGLDSLPPVALPYLGRLLPQRPRQPRPGVKAFQRQAFSSGEKKKFFWVIGEMSIPIWQEAVKDARRT